MILYMLEQCWEVGLRSTYRRFRFWQNKNHLFRWSSFWFRRVCIQAKLSHLGNRKPLHIHWKVEAPKTSHCLVLILVQRHNWGPFFFENEQGEAVTVNGDRYRAVLKEFLFLKNWRGGYWQHLGSTERRYVPYSRSFTPCFVPCFWRSHYHPHSWCCLATSELRFHTVGLFFVGCRQR